jgi:integrase/recombinase XerD
MTDWRILRPSAYVQLRTPALPKRGGIVNVWMLFWHQSLVYLYKDKRPAEHPLFDDEGLISLAFMVLENERVIEGFLTWFRAGHAASSVPSYKYALYPFKRWLEGRRDRGQPHLIRELAFEEMVEYLKHIHTLTLKPNTRAIYICAMKALYAYLAKRGISPFDPTLIPSTPIDVSKSSRIAATEEEVFAILSTFSSCFPEALRNKAAIAMLWDSGLRLGELLSLNIDSINLESMSGTVKTYKRRDHTRTFRWDYSTNELLKEWLHFRDAYLRRDGVEQNALFISLATNSVCGRLDRHVLQKALREACRKLDLPRQVTPHTLRHGCLSELLRDGMNIRQVQETAGHAKVTTTQIYTHVEDSELEQAYRKIQFKRRHRETARA